MRRRLFKSGILITVMVASAPVRAQFIDMSLPMMNSAFAVQAYSLNALNTAQANRNARKNEQDDAPVAARTTDLRVGIVSADKAKAPARLAQSYPEAQRLAADSVFRDLLRGYGEFAGRFGVAPDDMAGALAAFVAGSWMAYRNQTFPDANFKPLVAQMRSILRENPAFADATPAQRREAFEEFAILGTMAATTQLALAANPGKAGNEKIAANLKAAGAAYLQSVVTASPDRVSIDAKGLSLTPAP